jgi:hypothetical protein
MKYGIAYIMSKAIRWILILLVFTHAYAFINNDAILYWSEDKNRPDSIDPQKNIKEINCYYYYAFGKFVIGYDPLGVRVCPRTIPINAGFPMKRSS